MKVAALVVALAAVCMACGPPKSTAPPPDPTSPPPTTTPIDPTPPPPITTAPVEGIEHWASPTQTAAQFIAAAGARGHARGRVVRVSTTEQLVAALAPNTTILLAPGRYVFADSNKLGSDEEKASLPDFASLSPHYTDGEIHDLDNLALIGEGPAPAVILQPDTYAHALSFRKVDTISMFNLVIGHRPEKGGCMGGVVRIISGADVLISSTTLFGSGTEGLTLITVDGLTLENSVITDTTEQLSTISHSRNVRFDDVRVVGNGGDLLRGFAVSHAEMLLSDTVIINNTPLAWKPRRPGDSYGLLFYVDGDYDVAKWHVESPRSLDPPVAKSRIELRNVKIDGQTMNKVL